MRHETALPCPETDRTGSIIIVGHAHRPDARDGYRGDLPVSRRLALRGARRLVRGRNSRRPPGCHRVLAAVAGHLTARCRSAQALRDERVLTASRRPGPIPSAVIGVPACTAHGFCHQRTRPSLRISAAALRGLQARRDSRRRVRPWAARPRAAGGGFFALKPQPSSVGYLAFHSGRIGKPSARFVAASSGFGVGRPQRHRAVHSGGRPGAAARATREEKRPLLRVVSCGLGDVGAQHVGFELLGLAVGHRPERPAGVTAAEPKAGP